MEETHDQYDITSFDKKQALENCNSARFMPGQQFQDE